VKISSRSADAADVPPSGRVAALAQTANDRPVVREETTEKTGKRKPLSTRAYEPGRRLIRQEVTLTPTEQQQLRERAAQLEVTVPRLMVEAALAGTQTLTERADIRLRLDQLVQLLANIANNVNQVAHQANIEGRAVRREWFEENVERIGEMRGELEDLLREIR
jgi:Bacterial mobilisation protein (MobC)